EVELGLNVCLLAVRADQRRIAPAAEQQADGLRENRLPCSRLAGDRVEAGREVELGVADEDEVLDAQTAQHQRDGMWLVRGRPSSGAAVAPAAPRLKPERALDVHARPRGRPGWEGVWDGTRRRATFLCRKSTECATRSRTSPDTG